MSIEGPALYRLMVWLSPSFPVGAFSYSHGLEWLIESRAVTDEASLKAWVLDVLRHGSGRSDGILFAQAWRASLSPRSPLGLPLPVGEGWGEGLGSESLSGAGPLTLSLSHRERGLKDIAEFAAALSPSAERHLESTAQGDAFALTVRQAWSVPTLERLQAEWNGPLAYPVAVAIAAADHGIPLGPALMAFLHAQSANLISAGVRLIPLGQTAGQRITAAIEETVTEIAGEAEAASLDEVGSALILTDIASMRHETQYTRLFRS